MTCMYPIERNLLAKSFLLAAIKDSLTPGSPVWHYAINNINKGSVASNVLLQH